MIRVLIFKTPKFQFFSFSRKISILRKRCGASNCMIVFLHSFLAFMARERNRDARDRDKGWAF